MKLDQLITILETLAPLTLAEPWDKPGLHAGDHVQTVTRALLCIDLTEAVARQAAVQKAQLIVAYHPPIFEALATLTPTDWKTRALLICVKQDIAVYSPHTALDAAPEGLNVWLARGLGQGEIKPIKPHPSAVQGKLVVYVPRSGVDVLRRALSDIGAGQIGQYSRCSFNLIGEGTFQGNQRSHPTVGKPGQFERVEEVRMEMMFPWALRHEMIKTIRTHHPYEEPGMALSTLEPIPALFEEAGQGRILTLAQPISLDTLRQRIGRLLGVKHVAVSPAVGRARKIRTIGLCAGAGGSLLAAAGEVDAFFTGEMRYHDVLAATQRGVNILLAGHVETERPYLAQYRKQLASATGKAVTWTVSRNASV